MILDVLFAAIALIAEVKSESVSRSTLCNPWTTAHQAPPVEFSRKEYWKSFPSSVNLQDPGIESRSPVLQADSLPSEPPGKP